jgi:hypothetical protein
MSNMIPNRSMRIEKDTVNRLKLTKKMLHDYDTSIKNMDILINKALDSLLKEYRCNTIAPSAYPVY